MGELDLVDCPLDRLFVGHLGLTDVGFDLEFAAHAVHQDVQVKLAHTADDGLAGLMVLADLERRIFLGQLLDGQESFSWSLLVLGSMATWMTGSGNVIDSRTT